MSSLNDFKIGKLLGKGAFGMVILVHRIIDGQTYAMKQVRISQLTDKEKKNSLNEIRILASLSHKNIIGYKDAFFDENSKTLNIVMEYADGGDMSQKIKYNLKHGLLFRENIIWKYLIQILEGLNYLHEHNIIHRDLKSANIFLTKQGNVKIGDLNVSKIAKIGMAYTQTGTPYYASPEIWLDKPYNFKSDIWSLGCILYELCQLKPPFRGTSLKNLCFNIQRGIYEPIMSFYSDDLKKIIGLMLRTDPNMRPTTGQILKSKLIINKKKELKIEEDKIENEETQKGLIDTIKMPRNLKEINGNLPMNRYNKYKSKKMREEMMKEDEYETNKKFKGFLNDEDKKEIQKLYGNNNIQQNKNLNMNKKVIKLESNNINYKNNYVQNTDDFIKNLKKELNNYNFNNNQINYNNGPKMNNYNSDNSRINNIINNKQKLINRKNNINSNRIYLDNDLKSDNHNLNEINNLNINDDLISLNYNLIKKGKRINNYKFNRNMSDVEDNDKYLYRKNKEADNKKINNPPKNVDDYISQNLNLYNNINKYFYKNYIDLLSYNGDKSQNKPNINPPYLNNNYNNNINKQLSKNENEMILFKNKINSDKSPTKFNYIFNNENKFNNIKDGNKLNNSSNNNNKENKNNNFKLLMNNNFNPNININIYNNRDDKKPNLNNFDFIDDQQFESASKNQKINSEYYKDKKPAYNNYLELYHENENKKKNWFVLNENEDEIIKNNKRLNKNKKNLYLEKLKTENNEYINKKNKLDYINNIKHSDTESLNSQIYKLNPYPKNNKKQSNQNNSIKANNQGRIIPSKTPKLKLNKKHKNKNMNNNLLNSNENINDIFNNIASSNKYNYNINENINNNMINMNNNNFKKPNLLLNMDNYQPKLYLGLKKKNIKGYNNNISEHNYNNNLDLNIEFNNKNIIEKQNSVEQINRNNIRKKMNNDLFNLNFDNNYLYSDNGNIKKKNNYARRINHQNNNKKRPVSSIVQRKIENSNRLRRFEPSFNNQVNDITNNKLIDSLDQININNLNNFHSNKNQINHINNNINNQKKHIMNNIYNINSNGNDNFINYRNKVNKNKLEMINNFENYKNRMKSDYRKIEIKINNTEKSRDLNINKRVITPSPNIFYNKKKDENMNLIKNNKYRLKPLNGNIKLSKSNLDDINNNLLNEDSERNNYININKIEVRPKRKGKIIIEKFDYQPLKKRNKNKYKNGNNINKYQNFNDEFNNDSINLNNISNGIYNNDFHMNNINNIKSKNYMNYYNDNLYQKLNNNNNDIDILELKNNNKYHYINNNEKNNNIYHYQKNQNNFNINSEFINGINNINQQKYKNIYYSIGNNRENTNFNIDYLKYGYNI